MNKHFITIVAIAILLFSTKGYCGEVFILSLNGEIVEYDAGKGEIKTLIKEKECYWPCYDRKRNTIYFSSYSPSGFVVYSMELGQSNPSKVKVLDGMSPAISTDGKLLSYLVLDTIYVYDIESKRSWPVGTGANDRPAVWISDRKLIYGTFKIHMKIVDVITRKISGFWPDEVTPEALSPDGKTLLCSTYPSSSILLYSIDGKYIDTFKEPGKFYYAVKSLIWSSNGRSFISEHKSWWGLSPSLDTYHVYTFNIDTRKEKRIMHNVSISGGVSIGPSNVAHAQTGSGSETPRSVTITNPNDQLKWARDHD